MMTNNILLLFSDDFPCWDAETVSLAGENPETLGALEADGYISRLGEGYVLTRRGINEREITARENFVPVSKITITISDYEARKLPAPGQCTLSGQALSIYGLRRRSECFTTGLLKKP